MNRGARTGVGAGRNTSQRACRQRGKNQHTLLLSLIEETASDTVFDPIIAGKARLLLDSILLKLLHLGLNLIVEELDQLWFRVRAWVSDIVETKDAQQLIYR